MSNVYRCNKAKKNLSNIGCLSLDAGVNETCSNYDIIESTQFCISEQIENNYIIEHFLVEAKDFFSELEYKVIHLYLAGYSYDGISSSLKITLKKVDNSLAKYRRFVKDQSIGIY
jgi:hypothetical protein